MKESKRKMILTLLFTISLTASITLMVASFLPLFVDKKYEELSMTATGMIICAFEVGAFIFSPLIGGFLQRIGRKNVILIGYVIMAISTAFNGIFAIIDSEHP